MTRPLLLFACASLAALASAPSGPASAPAAKSPHGDPAACAACHAPGASASEPGLALPVVATCLSCHPTADMHPVNMAPNHVPVPAGWPLENGKVTCATCHAEPAHGGESATLTAPWHRGGPYPSVTRFCYACHEQEGYARSNPHQPAKAGDARDASCAACHTGSPRPGAALEQSRLRAGADKVCTGTCHTDDVHAGAVEHMGEAVSAELAATLPATMPLHQGQIACFTCHEVHGLLDLSPAHDRRALSEGLRASALADDWSALAGQAIDWPDGHDPHSLLAAPAADGSLCRACHGDGP